MRLQILLLVHLFSESEVFEIHILLVSSLLNLPHGILDRILVHIPGLDVSLQEFLIQN